MNNVVALMIDAIYGFIASLLRNSVFGFNCQMFVCLTCIRLVIPFRSIYLLHISSCQLATEQLV